MTVPRFTLPPGAEVLDASGRGGTGNITLAFRRADPPRVLKVYRVRRSRLREALGGFAHRFIEGKLGASAAARCATERLVIEAWTRAGFDVVKSLALPPPPGVAEPCNWLELMTGPTLQEVLRDPAVGLARKQDLLARLGRACASRHRLAIETRNPLLIHERGHVAHAFVEADRLVFFDLENAYQPTYPVARAAAREWAGFARSIRACPEGGSLLASFTSGYGDRGLLDTLLRSGLRGSRLRWLREATAAMGSDWEV